MHEAAQSPSSVGLQEHVRAEHQLQRRMRRDPGESVDRAREGSGGYEPGSSAGPGLWVGMAFVPAGSAGARAEAIAWMALVSSRIWLDRSSSSSVLGLLLLDRLPLVVGQDLPLLVRAVLADHHKRRQEDRLQRHDHRQQPEGVVLDPEADPRGEPEHVEVDEPHRAGEPGDRVGDAVLEALPPLVGVLEQRRIDWHGKRPKARAVLLFDPGPPQAGRRLRVRTPRRWRRPTSRAARVGGSARLSPAGGS